MADLLPNGCSPSAEVVVKELSDEALGDEDVSQSWIGGQGPQECDAVLRDS